MKTPEALLAQLKRDAEEAGYRLNPDDSFVLELAEGLLANEARYGYPACPCRLADGVPERDLDIVCPCDYRDADLSDFQACFCGLYVSEGIARGERPLKPIPERRVRDRVVPQSRLGTLFSLPVYRCKVCGYLCAREHPPERCPICKVKGERFETFA